MKENIKTSHFPYNTLCHPRVFLSGISTLLKKWLRLPITTLGNDSTVRAFTLIELLVVVLIIGILSAIALPQYQLAVEKSRLVGHFPLVKDLVESENIYFLANEQYTYDFDNLETVVSSLCPAKSGINEAYGCPHNMGFMLGPSGETYDGKSLIIRLRYCSQAWCTLSSGNTIAVLSFDTTGQLLDCTGETNFGQKLCRTIIAH